MLVHSEVNFEIRPPLHYQQQQQLRSFRVAKIFTLSPPPNALLTLSASLKKIPARAMRAHAGLLIQKIDTLFGNRFVYVINQPA